MIFLRNILASCAILCIGLVAEHVNAGVGHIQLQRLARQHFRNLMREGTQRLLSDGKGYDYRIEEVTLPVDHASYLAPADGETQTFKQRILINDTWWEKGKGPIFFYTGNEGNIETFAQNTGLMWDLAPKFHAMVVFAEHRYYGESNPVPMPESLDGVHPEAMQYLTTEQVLADFEKDMRYIRKEYDCDDCPIVAFGGSYGGMLAAYMRIRYPWQVAGAVAGSAPILYFSGDAPWSKFYEIVTEDFAACKGSISRIWETGMNMAATPAGRADLQEALGLCTPLESSNDWSQLRSLIGSAYVTMAMADYPAPADFLAPMPAWPVKESCKAFKGKESAEGVDLLHAVRDSISVLFGAIDGSDGKCLDWQGSATPDLDADAWEYQVCTEYEEQLASYGGISDMFWTEVYDHAAFMSYCQQRFGVWPKQRFAKHVMGGKDIRSISNIIFSNGSLDPWSGGGFTRDVNPTVRALWIEDGAHHLDLRSASVADPSSVVTARAVEQQEIERWVRDWRRGIDDMPQASPISAFVVGSIIGLGAGGIAVAVIAAFLGGKKLRSVIDTYEALLPGRDV